MENSIIPAAEKVTMTSIELVDIINSARKEIGAKLILHKNFITKIENHPGFVSAKFLAHIEVPGPKGGFRQSKCYRLPKREAELMVMSESLSVQTRVYDRLAAMEKSSAVTQDVKDPQLAAMVLMLRELDLTEQEQHRQASEVAKLQETVAVIEARTQPDNKHFTVMGYGNLVGIPMDSRTASTLGRKCANRSRDRGLIIGDVSDPRFGKVHSYHESILQEVFASTAEVTRHAN